MSYMFAGCTSLETIDFSNFNTENDTNFQSAFNECTSLKTIYVRNCDDGLFIINLNNGLRRAGIKDQVTIITE